MKVYTSLPDFMPRSGTVDLYKGIKLWRLWRLWGWQDLQLRYKRSWIGMGWIFISFSVFVFVKILIFNYLSSESLNFFAIYLSVGFLVFRYINAVTMDGCNVFLNADSWIKGESLPLSVYVYRAVFRNVILLLYSSIPVVLICGYFGSVNWHIITLIPAFLLLIINAVWVSILLGLVCARHRDVSHLITTVMSILYFLTPILWIPSDLGGLGIIAKYNPFTYYISIVRDPILLGTTPILSWIVVSSITLGGALLALLVYAFCKHRVVFWL